MGLFGKKPRSAFNGFPYTNFHDLNLDWVLKLCRFTEETLEELPAEIDKVVQEKLEEYVVDQKADIIGDILGADQTVNVMQLPDPDLPAFDNGGLTDNTNAWNALVDWMSKNGRQAVYLPSGTYLMGSFTPPENFAIVGDGRYSTTIKAARFQTDPLIHGTVKGLWVSDLTLDINAAEQGRPTDVINCTFNGALLTNLIIKGNATGIAAAAASTGHLQISNVVISKVTTGVIVPDATGNFAVSMANVDVIDGAATSTGFVLQGEGTTINGACVSATTAVNITGDNNNVTWSGTTAYANTGNHNTLCNNGVLLSASFGTVKVKADSAEETVTNTRTTSAAEATDTVGGGMTSTAGARTTTTTGDDERTAGSMQVTTTTGHEVHDVAGEFGVTAQSASIAADTEIELDATGGTITATANTVGVTAEGNVTLTGDQVQITSTKPLKYKTPTVLTDSFKAVQMQGADGNNYNVLVQGDTWPPESGGGGGGETTDPNAVHITGGTMTGALTMQGANVNLQNGATVTGVPTPTAGTDAASKAYVDQAVADVPKGDFLPLTGGTVTGNIGVAPAGQSEMVTVTGNGITVFDSGGNPIGTLMLSGADKLWTTAGSGLVVSTDQQSNTLKLTGNGVSTVTSAGDTQSGLVFGNGEISAGNARLTLVGTPTAGTDATTKQYVDKAIADIDIPTGDYLPLTGGTVTGTVTLNTSAPNDALILNGYTAAGELVNITKIRAGTIVNDLMSKGASIGKTSIKLIGESIYLSGEGNNTVQIQNVKSPTNTNDAANKAYVDSKVGGGYLGNSTFTFQNVSWTLIKWNSGFAVYNTKQSPYPTTGDQVVTIHVPDYGVSDMTHIITFYVFNVSNQFAGIYNFKWLNEGQVEISYLSAGSSTARLSPQYMYIKCLDQ